MARVYADVNEHMPRGYWDYDSVNISWGVLENYEIVRKIGNSRLIGAHPQSIPGDSGITCSSFLKLWGSSFLTDSLLTIS